MLDPSSLPRCVRVFISNYAALFAMAQACLHAAASPTCNASMHAELTMFMDGLPQASMPSNVELRKGRPQKENHGWSISMTWAGKCANDKSQKGEGDHGCRGATHHLHQVPRM